MKAHISRNGAPVIPVVAKPDGLSVTDMFNKQLFQPGSFSLDPRSFDLIPAQMKLYHCSHCTTCKPSNMVVPTCYFATMMKCITHGWHPPCNYAAIFPKYRTNGNYPSVAQYAVSAKKEFDDMVAHGVVIPCTLANIKLVNPIGAILKNSDKVRAKVLAAVHIVDQASLTLASDTLVAAGHAKVKVRLTTDLSATGINRASLAPPFRYPSLGDALRVVKRNGYIASGDVSRYFHSFPLAIDGRYYWVVEYGGIYWTYARCCFGHTACPYYASTWSAEFRQWAMAAGLDPAFMVDDWMICEDSLEKAQAGMRILSKIFEDCGFSMSIEKFQIGKQLVFIGVLIDSETMTMRFEGTQARGMRLQMQSYLELLCRGKHIDHGTIRHVCGKLNWYSEIVQSGRMHIRPWWTYQRNGAETYGTTMLKLVQDTQWWINLLQTWEDNRSGQVEYKILTAEEIQDNPRAMLIMQSDASGTDGFGYYYSYLGDQEMQYTSKRWNPPLRIEEHSHKFELLALDDFLTTDCDAQDAVLVWLTDNEGAAWTVNKGRCSDDQSAAVLTNILQQCDQRRLQIIALWVPREENQFADYLSHLAFYSDRDVVKGKVSDITVGASSSRGEGRSKW